MFLGIDHLVIAVSDPDDAAAELERELGLAATGGGRHDALGTFNRLVWLGDSYLELIGVFDRALAKQSWIGAPTARVLDQGGGLATWAIATDALGPELARLRAMGSNLGEPVAGERVRADGTIARWRVALPPLLGPVEPPFLIEHDEGAAEWTPADRLARSGQHHPAGGSVSLEAVELPVDDLNGSRQRFGRTAGLRFRPSLAGGGSRDASVGRQTVRLRPRWGGSAAALIHLAAPVSDKRVGEFLGCRWMMRPVR
jgi:hypothetical protein